MKSRPNIIMLSVDEMIYSALSCKGNKWLNTPNMDRLFENGMSFERSYSTNPVCSPARSSWATGWYTSEVGSCMNFCRMSDEVADIGQIMKEGGYYPVHAGKWHVEGRNPRESFHCLYYGNDEMWAMGAEIFDCAVTHAAISFFQDYNGDEPFYLQLGYVNPHDMCEYLHNYEFKEMPDLSRYGLIKELPPLPENFGILPNETAVLKAFRRKEDCLIHSNIQKAVSDWSENEWRYFIWNYYRYIEKADVEIGKIITALEGSRFWGNTIILFTVDHGESLGEHLMFQKFTLYEESIRVPFVITDFSGKYVRSLGSTSQALVSGVDVFGTICDYAGIENQTKSRSVRQIVEGAETKLRDYVYVENNYWGRAIIGRRYKLIFDYIPGEKFDYVSPRMRTHKIGDMQFFDLLLDPHETRDLSKDMPEEIEKMLQWLWKFEDDLECRSVHDSVKGLIERCQKRVWKEYGTDTQKGNAHVKTDS